MTDYDLTLMRLTTSLTQVARAYKASADKMTGDFDLSHASAWPVLMIGRLGDGVRPGTVADALGLEPPSLVRIIDQLIDSGLVERHEDMHDRRAKTLHLTAKGKQCASALEEALIPFRRALFVNMEKTDVEASVRVLEGLHVALTGSEVAFGTRKIS
ncbi:MarR family winged helix-turn-helix transcriptional regulator [Undibacterium sp. SXout7W]|uniref:MarR family winged helix-turn-helix transcriptional regulator n=1 Tax=Undibacterium sp. SXout7W TaxID=3413049 RepID=UPI003BEFEB78